MGKRSSFERRPQDQYDTPAEAVAPLLPHLYPRTPFVEPCAGNGKLIEHLIRAGHVRVSAFDLPDDARSKRYGAPPGAAFITKVSRRVASDHHQLGEPSSDVAPDRRRLAPHPTIDSVSAATAHDRQRWPSPMDQRLALRRQGQRGLAPVWAPDDFADDLCRADVKT
jgi:hypothetical protein